jgi:putative endonuclease
VVRVKDAVGRFGEELAARHLEADGLVILARNWRCSKGEIDIVAADGGTLVICEVKTRSGLRYGDPAESVLWAKQRRLRVLATCWLQEYGTQWRGIRFDVVTVLRRPPADPVVRHLREAF